MEERRPEERQREDPNLAIADLISEIIYKYIYNKLGRRLVEGYIEVKYDGASVEVSVDLGASPLVDEAELAEVADEAAELGVVLADMAKEGLLNTSEDKGRVLREALGRLKRQAEDRGGDP